jgi:hypothetical protein
MRALRIQKQQASLEVQEHQAAPGEKAIKRAPQQASAQLERMRGDTYLGMAPT